MDGVLEELMDEGGQGGCRVLGDDRPSEDKFKIQRSTMETLLSYDKNVVIWILVLWVVVNY